MLLNYLGLHREESVFINFEVFLGVALLQYVDFPQSYFLSFHHAIKIILDMILLQILLVVKPNFISLLALLLLHPLNKHDSFFLEFFFFFAEEKYIISLLLPELLLHLLVVPHILVQVIVSIIAV